MYICLEFSHAGVKGMSEKKQLELQELCVFLFANRFTATKAIVVLHITSQR